MTAEEMLSLTDKTVAELVDIICQLGDIIRKQEEEVQYWKNCYEERNRRGD